MSDALPVQKTLEQLNPIRCAHLVCHELDLLNYKSNCIMRLRIIACITMKGVFSLSSLFSYIVFNQGPVGSVIYRI